MKPKKNSKFKKTNSRGKNARAKSSSSPNPGVKVHPHSLRAMKKGHPWITSDSFSNRFPKNSLFLMATDQNKDQALLINSPEHNQIKARLWTLKPPLREGVHLFKAELASRIEQAIHRRSKLSLDKQRENYYLVFAEADFLPGLYVQRIGEYLFVQYYMDFWTKKEDALLPLLKDLTKTSLNKIIVQHRRADATFSNKLADGNKLPESLVITEFGIKYQLHFDGGHDFGLYTDMSAIRKKLEKYFTEAKSCLNLYSYTGAYGLFALKNGVQKLVSVDLSTSYNDWNKANFELNDDFKDKEFTIYQGDVQSTLKEMKKKTERFDIVICDPPTASSSERGMGSALKDYDINLPVILDLLKENGVAIVFLNTHSISKDKFRTTIQKILDREKSGKIIEEVGLSEDCITLRSFPEGDYLRGIVIKKTY